MRSACLAFMASDERLRRYLSSKCQASSGDQTVGHAIQLWQSLAAELVPIIGEEGFATLYLRSLHLTQSRFPWLVIGEMQQQADSLFSPLRTSLEESSTAEAGEATEYLFITFTSILAQLIGGSLTFNLLRAAWGDEPSETTNEE